jgi:hypothetical protein
MARPRDEQCPKRGPGLWHTTSGSWQCVHCDAVTYLGGDEMNKLRAQFIEGLFHAQSDIYKAAEPATDGDFSALTEDQWHRAILVRKRYEQGRITED